MTVSLDILRANASLAELEMALQQTEQNHSFELVSVAAGTVGGASASIATFRHRDGAAAPSPLVLFVVANSWTKDQQEAALNSTGKSVVCYASLLVAGQRKNVAVLR
jgi:hypothetical protein